MHLFACLVISSNIIRDWLAGWLASSFLVLNGYGYVFLHWMAWNWPYFLVADFFDQLLTYHSLMRLHQHASFALVIFACDHLRHSWSDLNFQEWWNKSAKIRLNCCMVLDFFSAEKFWWTLWSLWGYFVCNDNFLVGSVLDLDLDFVLLPRQILLCKWQLLSCILYNGPWGPSVECE